MKHRQVHFLTLALLLVLQASCSSTPKTVPIDDGLLVHLSAAERDAVQLARVERDEARDAHAAAKNLSKRAQKETDLALAQLKTARSAKSESEARLALADMESDASEAQAKRDLALSEAELKVARLRHGEAVQQMGLARAHQGLASAREQLAEAVVDLRKAEGLQDVDLVEAQEISIQAYREQVNQRLTQVEEERHKVRVAQSRVDEATAKLKDSQRERSRLSE